MTDAVARRRGGLTSEKIEGYENRYGEQLSVR